MPRDGELKIPDETFRNRNGEPEPRPVAKGLRTKTKIRGTTRGTRSAPRGVRPVELYFFSAALALVALGPAGTCRPEGSRAASPSTPSPVPVSTPTAAPRASESDLFRSSVRPVLLAH